MITRDQYNFYLTCPLKDAHEEHLWKRLEDLEGQEVYFCPGIIVLGDTSKPTNPKDAIGSDKLPLHLVSPAFKQFTCVGLLNGALKYGRANWREAGVRASIYYDALMRHMDAWFEGEWEDPDDHVPHLAAAAACLNIIIDAITTNQLVDDRNYNGGNYQITVDELTGYVHSLKAHHAGRNPKHWTIGDVD